MKETTSTSTSTSTSTTTTSSSTLKSMEEKEFNCIKIVVVGDMRSGKTSLIHRFINDKYPEMYIPTGFEKYTVGFEVGGHHFSSTIWDTSGALAYDTVRPLSYQNADVFLICFHLGDWHSLQNVINKWWPEIQQHCPSVPIILCGCQSDQRFTESLNNYSVYSLAQDYKRKPVFSEEALAISRQIGAITYVETTSLANNRTAQEAFEVSALAAKGKLNNNDTNNTNNKISKKQQQKQQQIKTSASSQTLTKHKSMFKLRKCKSKAEFNKSEHKKCIIM
ncbi:ras-like GTP-binding protein rhoA [Oppia nitens]|uniref:ras-like GTP-binding protein rhoA n=1 Tax=Oppia nitens TaxID=1686743 RepID=UPI0023DC19CC|nr:ras-like GTP-binding protein rhoA [Oppia nitens]